MMKKLRIIPVLAVWAMLTVVLWFGERQEISEAERRNLTQMPTLSAESVLDGSFSGDFEEFSLDQFPKRDLLRQAKALFHYNVLNQSDNNGIYVLEGAAAAQEYPLRETSVNYALKRLNYLYETYLTGSDVYMAVVPDKGYYLAEAGGQLAMDYGALFTMVEEGMPWATHVDLTGTLDADCYYATDTHWRQERLLETAAALCQAMGATAPRAEDYRITRVDRPFWGVYYGQAALPMEPDTMYLMESDLLDSCTVTNFETGGTTSVYDPDKLASRDLYDVYLSGGAALLTIENPGAATGKELIIFRDSFGSSIIPLILQDYAVITVIDIRYVHPDYLAQLVDFHGQDVLMLYSTLLLNNSGSMK